MNFVCLVSFDFHMQSMPQSMMHFVCGEPIYLLCITNTWRLLFHFLRNFHATGSYSSDEGGGTRAGRGEWGDGTQCIGGIRTGQALIVIYVWILSQRTQKREYARKKCVQEHMGAGL